MATKTSAAPAKVTYLIERGKERLTVEVPGDWKVTYGPAFRRTPDARGRFNDYGQAAPMALRFYENETKQRAIFTDVTAFRDLSIPVRRLVIETEAQSKSKNGVKGERAESEVRREETWVEETIPL
jgi:hypothetical protein